jgi:flagellar motor switch protein FliM
MKQLFALITENLSDEATLSLINVKVEAIIRQDCFKVKNFRSSDNVAIDRIIIGRSLCRNFAHHWKRVMLFEKE